MDVSVAVVGKLKSLCGCVSVVAVVGKLKSLCGCVSVVAVVGKLKSVCGYVSVAVVGKLKSLSLVSIYEFSECLQ